ncbi:Rossmann-like and DUF2520 domain-containing protein [Sphingopyxis macrogoltabida]|uniref:Cytoplasmic protein n=1 Tax=Sphingopyxis macrogoltabida TaxID=33050 RepID=A0AAC9AV36_SPHMC|nr:Rossmann-like and DUF2520 domain-containing protein [Sphingopyxis macrogoltabida]ALJ12965.1 cytoplasmic protein [Sphingopyxis macrogoltabida]AMU89568.1 cytoplasmic protein [Sphingopyxis macrogoltabida]
MTGFQQIGIVGAGRVAQALTLGLAPHSLAPPLLWARSPAKAEVAAARLGCAIAEQRLDRLMQSCDVVAIAVSDDAVEAVSAELAAVRPTDRRPFVCHVSGRSGAAILEPLHAAGALTAAIHPAMTFTGDPHGEAARMKQARFAVTGSSPQAIELAHRLVGLMGGIAVDIAEERRPLYHAALCHASNHLVTLIAGASDALRSADIDDPAAFLAPLVRAALENSLDRGFDALSGPLLRGDSRTIEGHLGALGVGCPDLLPAYRAMALATLDELARDDAARVSPELRKLFG